MKITDYLNKDEKYFQYFQRNIDKCINYFEYEYIFGDSATLQLFYIEKTVGHSFKEALVQLIIPYLYKIGTFRQLVGFDTKDWFQSINKDLENDIYYASIFENAKIEDFIEDLKSLPLNNKDNILHYEGYEKGSWRESAADISKIIDECRLTTKVLKITQWELCFEYYAETENYYVRYSWSTGA